MVPFISVALNAMCSFSVPIYLLEASILFNIVKGLLILIFFPKNQLNVLSILFWFSIYLLFYYSHSFANFKLVFILTHCYDKLGFFQVILLFK